MRASCLVVSMSLVALGAVPEESWAGGLFQRWRSAPASCLTTIDFECETSVQMQDTALPPAPPGMKWATVTEMVMVPVQRTRIVNGRRVTETVLEARQIQRQVLV